ncbi:MAG: zinc dependent phospholipase C family protein [Pseudomonadota bacterium]
MPALITHYLCGDGVLRELENAAAKKSIINNRNVFNLGTQGPDIFFYHEAWPWAKSHDIPALGDRMHDERTGKFILEALRYAKSAGAAEKPVLTAYLCGYICHYALDCQTHPYIFYRTGFIRKGEPDTKKFSSYHRRFETALDVLMLERMQGKKPSGFMAARHIRISGGDAEIIGRMYSSIFERIYGEKISVEAVKQSIKDMASITEVLHDRSGIKKFLLSGVEKLLGMQPMLSSMVHPIRLTEELDYLNLQHSAWLLPWDKCSKSRQSFPEMFDTAVSEAAKMAAAAAACLNDSLEQEKTMELIGNRSFSTGQDCELDNEFLYYDCIYE